MIKILEDIDKYQKKLIECKKYMEKLHNMCTKERKNAYELLELYGLTKRNFAISHSIILSLEEKIDNYTKRTELQSFLINTAENSINGGVPKYLIDKDSLFQINNDPYALFTLLSVIDEQLVDFEEFNKVFDADLFSSTSKSIKEIGNNCLSNISNKVEKMENNEIIDDDENDYNWNYDFANYALLKAIKKLSIRECDYLPSDVREEIIRLLQIGLKKFDTGDIYLLFNLAISRLAEINVEAAKLEESNNARRLKK